jgi:hypothetical protein
MKVTSKTINCKNSTNKFHKNYQQKRQSDHYQKKLKFLDPKNLLEKL